MQDGTHNSGSRTDLLGQLLELGRVWGVEGVPRGPLVIDRLITHILSLLNGWIVGQHKLESICLGSPKYMDPG